MKLKGNKIFYEGHVVVCEPKYATAFYMEWMTEELSTDGDMRQHAAELRHMNNDGTWGIKKHTSEHLGA